MSHLLFAGGGHSHALLLRQWAMRPSTRPGVEAITLVSAQPTSLYSGLIPACLSGSVAPEACVLDLAGLCRAAAVSFVQATATGLDIANRQLRLTGDRPPLSYNWLSLNLGAEVRAPKRPGCLSIKPLEPVLAALAALPIGAAVLVVGSGPAAVEVSLALAARGFAVSLIGEPECAFWQGFKGALNAAGVLLDSAVQSCDVELELHCTGSWGPSWLAQSGLTLDGRGRVLTAADLSSVNDSAVFASGDCGVIDGHERPPSGVWAVRAAPVLATNLQRAVLRRPLRRWRPQPHALQLLGDGRGRAWALWAGGQVGPSRRIWRWKQHLDQRFMAMLRPPQMGSDQPMACSGCAAKLADAPLRGALQQLAGGPLPPAEDAAAAGDGWLQSVDGFPALVADPYVNGRLTALHASSDLWACGASLRHGQALVTLPRCSESVQQELLAQTLAGVQSVLPLIGGHTLQALESGDPSKPLAKQLSLGLVVNGQLHEGQSSWGKGPLRSGDVLLLSRPIGTGVLFAAAQAGLAEPQWLTAALEVMQQSQAALVELLVAHGCSACTDVTGFGLLGHLNEMLEASTGVGVQLQADQVPALAGSLELLEAGVASTLAPSNAAALALWPELLGTRSQLLIDPQTCGPLLAAVPQPQAGPCLAAMHAAGFAQSALIGTVQRQEQL